MCAKGSPSLTGHQPFPWPCSAPWCVLWLQAIHLWENRNHPWCCKVPSNTVDSGNHILEHFRWCTGCRSRVRLQEVPTEKTGLFEWASQQQPCPMRTTINWNQAAYQSRTARPSSLPMAQAERQEHRESRHSIERHPLGQSCPGSATSWEPARFHPPCCAQ